MKKVFGTNPILASMNTCFAMICLLAVIGIFCTYKHINVWDSIIPAITAVTGFIFGQSAKKGEK